MYFRFLKPILDFILALILLSVLSPILLIILLFLFFTGVKKPIFLQERIGYKCRSFVIIKFRTMNDKKGSSGILLSDKERLTFIGKIIRKLSLDELPQLINVLKGEMSLIGPRPLLPRYLPYYTQKENLRHSVKPGISGLAQINGRNTLDWNKRLAYDVEYVVNITLRNDFLILLKSIKIILFSDGGYVDPRSVMKDLDDERETQISS